ncbi:MAG: PP0621 family protein, partial [Polaromonas sp.]
AARPRTNSKETEVTEMVACDVCQVHLPRSEALIGSKGIYCSDEHRRQAGD